MQKELIILSAHQRHSGIDCARLIAAVFVLAIHVFPYTTISQPNDALSTLLRTTGRLAVPFFLMTTGYFLFPKQTCNVTQLKKYISRILILYGIATALYLPILVYANYFQNFTFSKLLKDILFNGTFYHLWYLPASILGTVLVFYLIKYAGSKAALAISFALYLIGTLGDSYHGFTTAIPYLKGFYQFIFRISDFTRNGIFFAPIFILFGSWLSTKAPVKSKGAYFLISYTLMVLESFVLNILHMQRHDCMYLFLLPTSVFLFCMILHWKTPHCSNARRISTTMYITHPIIMIAVRLVSKLLNIQHILLENKIIYFCISLILSILVGYVEAVIQNDIQKRKGRYQP